MAAETLSGLRFCCAPKMCLNLSASRASTGLVQEIRSLVKMHIYNLQGQGNPQSSSAILKKMILCIKLKSYDLGKF